MAAVLAVDPHQHPPTTLLHYTWDVETFLVLHLGRVRLADLDLRWLAAGFARIAATTNRCGLPQSPSRLHHIRTTLRAVLNFAVREGGIVDNPARRLELPAYRPPRPRVWTDGRVAQWRATGARPAVAVWTPEQLAAFLEAVAAERVRAVAAGCPCVGCAGVRRPDSAGAMLISTGLSCRSSVPGSRSTTGCSRGRPSHLGCPRRRLGPAHSDRAA